MNYLNIYSLFISRKRNIINIMLNNVFNNIGELYLSYIKLYLSFEETS